MFSHVLKQGRNFFVVQGVLAVVAAVVMVVWPAQSTTVIALVFAAWMVVDGVISVGSWLRSRVAFFLVKGVFQILLGVVVALAPAVFAGLIVGLLSFVALLVGVFVTLIGLTVRQAGVRSWWAFVLVGVLGVVVGLFFVVFPQQSLIAVLVLVSAVLLVVGVVNLAIAFSLGRQANVVKEAESRFNEPGTP